MHVVFAAVVARPGHLSIDEGIYHQMSRALADGMWPEVWNGYDEFPSAELRDPLHRVKDGELLPQYPYLYPVLAYPFYVLGGYRGLFVLNALALLAVAGLCMATARRLYGESHVAGDSVILLMLGTFIWQYGHAAWPHALSAAFVGAALLLAVVAADEADRQRAVILAACGGLVIGFGAGTRLDVAFAAPALVVPFLFAAPTRLREAMSAAGGMVPGLSVLAVTNYLKFGTFNPFSYGAVEGAVAATSYFPLAMLGLLVLTLLWVISRPSVWDSIRRRSFFVAAGLSLLVLGIVALPPVLALLMRLANGASQLIVDLRIRGPNYVEPGLDRGPMGSFVYVGIVKTSLVQNLPWLPVAVVTASTSLRAWRSATQHQVLILAVAGYVGAYSFFAWHGGMSFNLRYFVPILPVLAIYGARGMHKLTAGFPERVGLAYLAAGGISVFLWIYLLYRSPILEAQEPFLLNVPLIGAALLSAGIIWHACAGKWRYASRVATGAMLVFCMTWSSVVAIGYDFTFSALRRGLFATSVAEISPFIRPDSIVFCGVDTANFGLMEKPRIRIASVNRDEFADFEPLARYHLAVGRPVYLAFDDETWAEAKKRGVLDRFQVRILTKYLLGTLAEISLRPDTR